MIHVTIPRFRTRYILLISVLALSILSLLYLSLFLPVGRSRSHLGAHKPKPIIYKPKLIVPPSLPEYFPAAAKASSPHDLPSVPSWNRPPAQHVPKDTRLYLGFTHYWPLSQQAEVSYITAGWPPEDIYVVENTGTFDANKRGQLTSQNPFCMDYHRLIKILGVNVITMPSLQTFESAA